MFDSRLNRLKYHDAPNDKNPIEKSAAQNGQKNKARKHHASDSTRCHVNITIYIYIIVYTNALGNVHEQSWRNVSTKPPQVVWIPAAHTSKGPRDSTQATKSLQNHRNSMKLEVDFAEEGRLELEDRKQTVAKPL